MYSRPKPGETEDDLLRMQEEFFKEKSENKVKLAATVVPTKKRPADTTEDNTMNKISVEEQLENTFEAVPTDLNIGNIIEKKNVGKVVLDFKCSSNRGFPVAKRRDPKIISTKGSIFSQSMKKIKTHEPSCSTPMEVAETSNNAQKVKIQLPSQSYILSGTESKHIHEENLNMITQMSEEEILEERSKLLATMDPAIVTYLKSQRNKAIIEEENRYPTIKEQNEVANDISVDDIETPKEILEQPYADKWLNFNVVESNKLVWMKNVDVPKIDKSKPFEARFDFEGWLLPFSDPDINEKTRILYHHGEEPGRPGYTLQELFQLSRSTVMQQQIIALNCISNILAVNSTGVYDEIIDIPIEQVFFVVRFCLDDNTPSVLNASIKALRNLIFFHIDETMLDNLLGFGLGLVQPVLAVEENEDDNTINDQQLAESNLIKCLARTNILARIRYIISTIRPSVETLVYCMEILTRLARDSQFVMTKILNCDGLIDNIISKLTDSISAYEVLKFLRVLSSRSKHIAAQLVNKHKIMESLTSYLANDTLGATANGLKLQIESMHFWSLLLHYDLTLNYLHILEPVLLRLLNYHFNNTELNMQTIFVRQGHVAALLILLKQISKKQPVLIGKFVRGLFEQCLPKWAMQFGNLSSYSCGKLQIISSLLSCLAGVKKNCASLSFDPVDKLVLHIVESKGFAVVTENINCGSMILNNFETHKTSSNLKSLEGAAWNSMEHVVPIMQSNSCLPFLYSMTEYLSTTEKQELKLAFLKHKNIVKYLESIRTTDKYSLTNNWFTRIESQLLMNILKLAIGVSEFLDTSIYFDLAVKCLAIFTLDQKAEIEYLLENIVFRPSFYPSQVLLQNLAIKPDSTQISSDNLADILKVYTQVLNLQSDVPNFTTNTSLDVSACNVIPVDWIYAPIVVFYSNQEKKQSEDEAQVIYMITNCLRWILLYETYFPALAASINPTDKFCRLACVFLGNDSLFLNPEIHALLEHCFKKVLTHEKELNFQKEIQGLNNFQDFYTLLLEQYQGVSYGDVLFGNFILVPLAQKHNVQYRKTLWSEYMGVVQCFNVTPEQTMSDVQMYLEPLEEDMSLLKSFRRALVNNTVRKHSVLYAIITHHVQGFIRKRSENK